MTILWADGFDHYSAIAEMVQAGYSTAEQPGNVITKNTALARTGEGQYQLDNGGNRGLRKILDASVTTMGVGCGLFTIAGGSNITAPSVESSNGISFETAVGTRQFHVSVGSDLSIIVFDRPSFTIIGKTGPNAVNLNTWYWLEIKAVSHATLGSIEIRLQGNTVLTINVLAMPNPFTSVFLASYFFPNNGHFRIDDFVIWDNSGADHNDFLGERRCFTSYANADTALDTWVPSSGTDAFAMIDESTPNDADYIEAATAGDISEFTKQAIGINSTDVAAVVVFARVAKTDAGASTMRIGLNSASFVINSPAFSPSTAFSYKTAIFPRNPNGNIPWTKAAVDAATLRLTRDT